jgi:hypothetical protein
MDLFKKKDEGNNAKVMSKEETVKVYYFKRINAYTIMGSIPLTNTFPNS